ncbi:MAG: cation diffusion facilitator family transporter [bacterium]
MKSAKIKKQAALLSVVSNSILIFLKFLVGMLTGSISIISEAIHSFIDLLASVIAFFSVKLSSEPADIEHQYGHGKFEDLSGIIEGFLILVAAAYIIHEATERLMSGSIGHIETTAGIFIMLISVLMNTSVSSYLFKIANKTESVALFADAQHLKMDVYTSISVLLGLIFIKLTNLVIFDSLIAIVVALLIIKAGINLCVISGKNLLDTSLSKEERNIIENTIKKYTSEGIIKVQGLKTRKAGAERLIDLTLVIPEVITIKEGHDLCNKIEEDLMKNIKNSNTTIHLEPCEGICSNCDLYYKDSLICHKFKNK